MLLAWIFPHGERAHPNPMLAVKSLVDYHIFQRLAVFGKPHDLIPVAFVVAVNAQRDRVHAAILWHSFHLDLRCLAFNSIISQKCVIMKQANNSP
jgi:hypothetical protein